jgi:hypothetical protein
LLSLPLTFEDSLTAATAGALGTFTMTRTITTHAETPTTLAEGTVTFTVAGGSDTYTVPSSKLTPTIILGTDVHAGATVVLTFTNTLPDTSADSATFTNPVGE